MVEHNLSMVGRTFPIGSRCWRGEVGGRRLIRGGLNNPQVVEAYMGTSGGTGHG